MKFRLLYSLVLSLVPSIFFPFSTIAQGTTRPPLTSFGIENWTWKQVDLSPLIPVLQNKLKPTKIPQLLPTKAFVPRDRPIQVYFDVIKSTSDSYVVMIKHPFGGVDTCKLPDSCHLGFFQATKLTDLSPTLPNSFSPESEVNQVLARSKEEPTPVNLSQNIKGYFSPWVCSSNRSSGGCTDSRVSWDQNGYRYSVGTQVASKKNLVEMANSAIASQK
jgi:hypothetical protein